MSVEQLLPVEPGGWRVHAGEALDVMARLPSSCIDAIITDPPYGTADPGKVALRGEREIRSFDLEWDREMPLDWLVEAERVLKPGAAFITFVDAFEVTTMRNALRDAGLRPLRPLYWIKTGPPHCPRANFTNAVEVAVFARKPGPILYWPRNSEGGYVGTNSNVWEGSTDARRQQTRTGHPTQKPEALVRWLATVICPPDGLVLDPFCGAGTTGVGVLGTGVEANVSGRRFVGIDRDPHWVAVTKARLTGFSGAVAGAVAGREANVTGGVFDLFGDAGDHRVHGGADSDADE